MELVAPLRFKVPLVTVVNVPTAPTVSVPVSKVPIVALFTMFVLPAPVRLVKSVVPVSAVKFRLLAAVFALVTAPNVWSLLAKAEVPEAPMVKLLRNAKLPMLLTFSAPALTVVPPS